MQHNIPFRVRNAVRRRFIERMQNIGAQPPYLLKQYFPLTIPQVKIHFESQFLHGMTWDNYGTTGLWEVDHIIPISRFDLTQHSHRTVCFSALNTRPAWRQDNANKGIRIIESLISDQLRAKAQEIGVL